MFYDVKRCTSTGINGFVEMPLWQFSANLADTDNQSFTLKSKRSKIRVYTNLPASGDGAGEAPRRTFTFDLGPGTYVFRNGSASAPSIGSRVFAGAGGGVLLTSAAIVGIYEIDKLLVLNPDTNFDIDFVTPVTSDFFIPAA